jgi:hypothetical protein
MNHSAPILLSVQRIWDKAPHSALTDLIQWKGGLWCIFREADQHFGGKNGILRLLKSSNGVVFQLAATIELEGWDLRDPKLSQAPDGSLMLLAGASFFNRQKERLAHQSVVSFSSDGSIWAPLNHVLTEEWLWRITWYQGKGYGIAYYFLDPLDPKSDWGVRLYETENGIHYRSITSFDIPGHPNEATVRFLPDGQMIVLLRRNGPEDDHAWLGLSFPPYEDWIWTDAGMHFGGPNFLILPDNTLWAAGRMISTTPYGFIEQTVLARINKTLEPRLIFPSGGDTSYPGMVYEEPNLWVSYYSSHEGTTGIYLAKVALG